MSDTTLTPTNDAIETRQHAGLAGLHLSVAAAAWAEGRGVRSAVDLARIPETEILNDREGARFHGEIREALADHGLAVGSDRTDAEIAADFDRTVGRLNDLLAQAAAREWRTSVTVDGMAYPFAERQTVQVELWRKVRPERSPADVGQPPAPQGRAGGPPPQAAGPEGGRRTTGLPPG